MGVDPTQQRRDQRMTGDRGTGDRTGSSARTRALASLDRTRQRMAAAEAADSTAPSIPYTVEPGAQTVPPEQPGQARGVTMPNRYVPPPLSPEFQRTAREQQEHERSRRHPRRGSTTPREPHVIQLEPVEIYGRVPRSTTPVEPPVVEQVPETSASQSPPQTATPEVHLRSTEDYQRRLRELESRLELARQQAQLGSDASDMTARLGSRLSTRSGLTREEERQIARLGLLPPRHRRSRTWRESLTPDERQLYEESWDGYTPPSPEETREMLRQSEQLVINEYGTFPEYRADAAQTAEQLERIHELNSSPLGSLTFFNRYVLQGEPLDDALEAAETVATIESVIPSPTRRRRRRRTTASRRRRETAPRRRERRRTSLRGRISRDRMRQIWRRWVTEYRTPADSPDRLAERYVRGVIAEGEVPALRGTTIRPGTIGRGTTGKDYWCFRRSARGSRGPIALEVKHRPSGGDLSTSDFRHRSTGSRQATPEFDVENWLDYVRDQRPSVEGLVRQRRLDPEWLDPDWVRQHGVGWFQQRGHRFIAVVSPDGRSSLDSSARQVMRIGEDHIIQLEYPPDFPRSTQ